MTEKTVVKRIQTQLKKTPKSPEFFDIDSDDSEDIDNEKIQQAPSENDTDNDSEKKEPVRKIKPFTKRISLIHSTELFEKDLDMGHEEDPGLTKGIEESMYHMLIPTTSKKCRKQGLLTSE